MNSKVFGCCVKASLEGAESREENGLSKNTLLDDRFPTRCWWRALRKDPRNSHSLLQFSERSMQHQQGGHARPLKALDDNRKALQGAASRGVKF